MVSKKEMCKSFETVYTSISVAEPEPHNFGGAVMRC
jgi:hypothetical protein